jgi:16S rRNA pseudouridine516 synthase
MHSNDEKHLLKLLLNQALGSRKQCKYWIKHQLIEYEDPSHIKIDGQKFIIYPYPTYIALNKPCGYECSHHPSHHPSVFDLLPPRLKNMGLECVGRLDVETSGLLLLSNDGQWLHRLIAPKNHVKKTYQAYLKHPIEPSWLNILTLDGVFLRDTPHELSHADEAQWINPYTINLTIHEGRYHQVRRMISAAGNRVEKLDRIQFGSLHISKLQGLWQFIDASSID